ncbi:MAG: hypothetical protein U1E53_16670 [Dongiaceae bacterium]
MPDLGVGGDLARLGDAAGLHDVGLHHLDGAGVDQPGEGVAGLGLEAGDGEAGAARQLGAAGDVLGRHRLLEPAHLQPLQRLGVAHGDARGQRGGGVDHQVAVGAERLARRGDPGEVLLDGAAQRHVGQGAGMHRLRHVADLHLVAAIAATSAAKASSG